MKLRLGFMFPPCGGEDELYVHGERLSEDVRILLMGTRIFGGEEEHAPHHLSATGAIAHLVTHARVMARMQPDVVLWACTSGSFIDGLHHAECQAEEISKATGCPASSTSIAFVSALRCMGISQVALLASYPEVTTNAFRSFLQECGIDTKDSWVLDAPSGPAAAALGDKTLLEAASALSVPDGGALLIPDTAMPSMHLIEPLEDQLNCMVLTANQVTLWEAFRLAGGNMQTPGPGRLFD